MSFVTGGARGKLAGMALPCSSHVVVPWGEKRKWMYLCSSIVVERSRSIDRIPLRAIKS